MKPHRSALIITTAILMLSIVTAIMPNAASALDLIVMHNPPNDSTHYPDIQSALAYANGLLTGQTPTTANFRVIVMADPNPYPGSITAISNIPIIGSETARTFISGPSTGAAITISGVTGVTIRNLTFINVPTGISISSNSTNITIENNVFQVGTSSTAIQTSSPTANIINNTFYQNGTAINTGSDTLITNNIFALNGTAITSLVPLTQASYNDYSNNSNNGNVTLDVHSLPNISVLAPADPLFVAPGIFDFHLLAGSPCHMYSGINAGNPSYANAFDSTTFDMGAYGGPNMDTIPYIISGVALAPGTGSVTVSWEPNNSYVVTNPTSLLQGGYNVYYSLNRSGAPYDNKVSLSSGSTSTTISGLITTATPPDAPALSLTGFKNQELDFAWTSVSGATSYNLFYTDTDAATPVEQVVNGITDTSFALTGLVNGHHYTVQVTAVSQPTYYFAVTAFDYTVAGAQGGTPGSAHESNYQSPDIKLPIGTAAESVRSNPITEYPETLVPYPNLPHSNQGCFIATAAYGHYSAPQVQALRDFRDQYLLAISPGRAFVKWYYTYGPTAAAWLNAHPEYKPVVRAALWPAVGLSVFMTQTSPILRTGLVLTVVCVFIITYSTRRRSSGSGGSH